MAIVGAGPRPRLGVDRFDRRRLVIDRVEFWAGEQLAVERRRLPQLGVGALGDDASARRAR